MSKKKLFLSFFLGTFLVCLSVFFITNLFSRPDVKGVKVEGLSSPTALPTKEPSATESQQAPLPTDTPRPTATPSPSPSVALSPSPTIQEKQIGGWYWRDDLKRSQRYVGTDDAGEELWSDHAETPTPIPTESVEETEEENDIVE